MKCPSCNKSASIAIGTKRYCTGCGERMTVVTPPVAPVVRSLDLSRAPVRTAVAPTPRRKVASPVVAPIPSSRLMRDVVGKSGVLDLRQSKPIPVEATALPTRSDYSARQHNLQNRLATAAKIDRSSSISHFTAPAKAPEALPVQPVTALPAVPPAASPLPQHAATQHEHLGRLLELTAKREAAEAQPFSQPGPASFATAAAAIVIMSGYIWIHNYPHLAMTTAADRAGFSASLPNFVPSSYHLNGGPAYAPGLVTLSFNSPSFSDPLKVTQQPTTWDSSSLLDNYVASKTSDFSTVTGQGLTIYLINGNQQAAWINHGIWYTVEGATHLGRDQLLKMAYSF